MKMGTEKNEREIENSCAKATNGIVQVSSVLSSGVSSYKFWVSSCQVFLLITSIKSNWLK